MGAGRRLLRFVVLIGVFAATAAVALGGTASWGRATEVPGLAGLNVGGNAEVYSVSCPTAGSCAAGGSYSSGPNQNQAFVTSEKNGVWRNAIEVPGSAALNGGGNAYVSSVSCPTAGFCAAGGSYLDASSYDHAFILNETNGIWRKAIGVPGSAAFVSSQVDSISCSTAGSCTASGTYVDGSFQGHAFVVSEKHGVWRKAIDVPGSAALALGGGAEVSSISCPTADSCAAGGFYLDGSGIGHDQAFVVSERNGVWRKAIEVPGSAALNLGSDAEVYSISCPTAGSCAAGGYYLDGSGHDQAFVVSEKNGVWRNATEVPGSAALNLGGNAETYSVSCPTAGSCAAVGQYLDGSAHGRGFVVNEKNGVWRKAIPVPGPAALAIGAVTSVACSTAGDCAAGGFYIDGSGHEQLVVVSEKNGVWRKAIPVPGSGALNLGGYADVSSISCPTSGSCTVGGFYHDGSNHQQALVVSEENGTWRKAMDVPGSVPLNLGGSYTDSISCPTAGTCTASGSYIDGSSQHHHHAFLVTEKHGVWSNAIEVPGSAALNVGGNADVDTTSCPTFRSCAAGGYYEDGSNHTQALVVSEKNGVWRNAAEVRGSPTFNAGGSAEVYSISCATAGSCAAGGYYNDGSAHDQAFVVSEKNGVWRKATEVRGSAALNVGGNAQMDSISCATAGSCAAGGYYSDGSGHFQAFVVSERNGVWSKAIEVPHSAALNLGGGAFVLSTTCATAGSCEAGGYYTDGSNHQQAFVVNEKNGVWRKATEVRGSAALNGGGNAAVESISCPTAGSCAAGGYYTNGSGSTQAFVVSEKNGVWHKAIEVPGFAALNLGSSDEAGVYSISCATAGSCAAGGTYFDGSDHLQAFVVREKNGVWRKATEVPGSAALNVDGYGYVSSVSCSTARSCGVAGAYTDGNNKEQAFVTAP
jgi:hypothetical protein